MKQQTLRKSHTYATTNWGMIRPFPYQLWLALGCCNHTLMLVSVKVSVGVAFRTITSRHCLLAPHSITFDISDVGRRRSRDLRQMKVWPSLCSLLCPRNKLSLNQGRVYLFSGVLQKIISGQYFNLEVQRAVYRANLQST